MRRATIYDYLDDAKGAADNLQAIIDEKDKEIKRLEDQIEALEEEMFILKDK